MRWCNLIKAGVKLFRDFSKIFHTASGPLCNPVWTMLIMLDSPGVVFYFGSCISSLHHHIVVGGFSIGIFSITLIISITLKWQLVFVYRKPVTVHFEKSRQQDLILISAPQWPNQALLFSCPALFYASCSTFPIGHLVTADQWGVIFDSHTKGP